MISTSRLALRALAVALALRWGSFDGACTECPTLNFDSLAAGIAVTNQFSGVTFSVVPQTCGGLPVLYLRTYTPPNGTSSGSRCLRIDGGCPDFSDDYARLVFDRLQQDISFTLGDWATTYTLRTYSTTSGAGLISSTTVTLPPAGGGDVGVHRRVQITSASRNIRRLEIQAATSAFEAIDDLTYDVDATPPIATITSPVSLDCVCNGSEIVGSAYDPDGTLALWQLHRRALGASSWVLIGQSTRPVTNDTLSVWTSSGGDGYYTLRLTVENACGEVTVWNQDVYLDRAFNTLSLRSPSAGQILGGTVCVDGTSWDHCAGTIAVESRPAAGGAWSPVTSVASPWVITDQLGEWNTRTVADGNYLIRIRGTDNCGNALTQQVAVVVDNTAPVANVTAPQICAAVQGSVEIRGTAADANLGQWILQYAGAGTHHWVSFATGTVSVVNSRLADWNTTGLTPCAYVIRLLVTDQSVLNCNGELRNQSEYLTTVRIVSDPLARDTDGDGMPDAWETTYRLDPNNAGDANKDADDDGQTNLEEYQAGTDPRDRNSVLKILAINLEDDDVRITWSSAASRHYQLLAGTNLSGTLSDPISPLISIPPGGPTRTNYLHRAGAAAPDRYYRVRLVP